MTRCASIDVGTNTVLLLVAERRPDGAFAPLVERAEITRLGRGVDRTGRLDPAAIRDTVAVLARYAREARALGAEAIACVATSAARDAANSAEFFDAAAREAGLTPEVISGDEEARLVYASAWRDFGEAPGARAAGPLAVVDVGGGSTEVTFGDGPLAGGRQSLQVGAVRLTERHVRSDPLPPGEASALRAAAAEAMRPLAPWAGLGGRAGARLIGVAGTVTTLSAVSQELERYDAGVVHGAPLALAEVERLYALLAGLSVAERARLPGMEPKRADVIVGGCAVVAEAMRALGFDRLTVSDRGVRWGLLYDRLGDG
ncbi:MAG TPA: Ppx/GppA phosphatase family protein [Anaeromyxobacteraceae bacterium]|nr:Ppx/GppA phosphatase family protein [Anaeromyxobacteraceae bacterium]